MMVLEERVRERETPTVIAKNYGNIREEMANRTIIPKRTTINSFISFSFALSRTLSNAPDVLTNVVVVVVVVIR